MKWIESAGGPLVMIGESSVSDWSGIEYVGDSTDYQRACSIEDYLGIIEVQSGSAIVFGDEPLRTCWIPDGKRGGVIVRWIYGQDETSLIEIALTGPGSGQFELVSEDSFRSRDEVHRLFDAAIPGGLLRSEEHLSLNLAIGSYAIKTMVVRVETPETAVLLHELQVRKYLPGPTGSTASFPC